MPFHTTTKTALVLVTNGSEEIEFTTVVDLLVRAGIQTQSASVAVAQHQAVTCSRGVRVLPDVRLEDLSEETLHDYNLLVIPGGLPGATTLSESPLVLRLVQDYFYRPTQSALIGMICAGPLVALEAGLWKAEGGDGPDRRSWVEGKLRLTSHPSVKDRLEEHFCYLEDAVVRSRNLVTSRGPGTAIPFALALIEALCGKEKKSEVSGPLMT